MVMVLYTASAEHLRTLTAWLFVGRCWFGRPWGWLRAEIQRFVQKLETPELELLQLCQKRAPKGTPFSHFFTLSSDEDVSLITEYLQNWFDQQERYCIWCFLSSCLCLLYWPELAIFCQPAVGKKWNDRHWLNCMIHTASYAYLCT